jgi:hypothetical protein
VAEVFSRRAELGVKLVVLAIAGGAVAGAFFWTARLGSLTAIGEPVAQPIPFSHKHHVGDVGLDCRYCHTTVETAAFAGMPSTRTCLTCHSQLFVDAPVLAPLHRSDASGKPIAWKRLHKLPDFVYFDHSIHVAKGIGCTECHGPIGDMPLTYKAKTLYMSWCLDCHRNPAPHLRPSEAVFDPHWHRTRSTPSGRDLMALYHIHPRTLTDCSVCHR